jgi:glyceraldehyde 3-phosphate dehydrogenase
MRVPIPDGSIVDLVTVMKRDVDAAAVNAAVSAASRSPSLQHILRYSEDPLVSSDIVGDPHSCIYDAEYTHVLDGRMLKTLSWYDNEWGYSNRVVDVLDLMEKVG